MGLFDFLKKNKKGSDAPIMFDIKTDEKPEKEQKKNKEPKESKKQKEPEKQKQSVEQKEQKKPAESKIPEKEIKKEEPKPAEKPIENEPKEMAVKSSAEPAKQEIPAHAEPVKQQKVSEPETAPVKEKTQAIDSRLYEPVQTFDFEIPAKPAAPQKNEADEDYFLEIPEYNYKKLNSKYYKQFLEDCRYFMSSTADAEEESYHALKAAFDGLQKARDEFPVDELRVFYIALNSFLKENNMDYAPLKGTGLLASARYFMFSAFNEDELQLTPSQDSIKEVFALLANPLYYHCIDLKPICKDGIPLYYTTPDKAIEALRNLGERECSVAETNKAIINSMSELKELVKNDEYVIIDFCKKYKREDFDSIITFMSNSFLASL